MHKYKLNNSYTVYVPNKNDTTDYGEVFVEKQSPLEWECGAIVCNYFYGKGKITSISEDSITVHFYGTSKSSAKKNHKKASPPLIITYQKEDAFKDLQLIRK